MPDTMKSFPLEVAIMIGPVRIPVDVCSFESPGRIEVILNQKERAAIKAAIGEAVQASASAATEHGEEIEANHQS